jgi:D-sedoheptulose 7-phosphate isomerase
MNPTHALARSNEADPISGRVPLGSGEGRAHVEGIELYLRIVEGAESAALLEDSLKRIAHASVRAHQQLIHQSIPVLRSVAQELIAALRAGKKLLFCGNGGSAADSQHVAAELMGRFLINREPWPAIALTTDSSILTAIGNDWEFGEVFSRQVRALAQPGDVVIGISTSGNSDNVLRAMSAAKEKGAKRIAFVGRKGGLLKESSDLCFCAPSDETPRIQELHILAWHAICEVVEGEMVSG